MSMQQFDVVIVGGGMIGSSLALALQNLPLKVALVEPFAPIDDEAPGFDARAIALSRTTAKILRSLDLWSEIKPDATAIQHIHVSDKGRMGLCHFSAAEVNLPAMGYVVELQNVARVMHKALQNSDVNLFCPASLATIQPAESGYELSIINGDDSFQCQASLVIAADGGRSQIRDSLNIPFTTKTYNQSAIISTLSTQKAHQYRAYERFTDNGPVAFLPLSDNRISMVWMVTPEEAKRLMTTEAPEFIAELQQAFGQRLGNIERLGERYCYPLNLVQTDWQKPGLIFVGNAAQSLHPIAGQGFNLGLRDVADLVDVMRDACIAGENPGAESVCNRYHAIRAQDKSHIVTLTDALARLFANPSPLLSLPRNVLLGSLSLMPEVRHQFTQFAMGMNHRSSRLTRGLPIALEEPVDG